MLLEWNGFKLQVSKADRPISEVKRVKCFHCGRQFALHVKNIRTVNYCGNC